ncbi:hypothetical protein PFICI_10633 [Pestalotiopsis fici W106-1]|uniref:N-acetyltransferase domain-containing protein n=1 Tax=Pestalotiopsis fici (strain W106-1 / CGMCC3.15140) TaxID=1229662 RepID=W3X099_PESFW|nr:uncharacterized protein PFICI_10633 [Pestalotiopsis fici W106-1]ETS78571.1 hypothetical protein PFICI_10633 [Pestalotiopsis fici W106-1]
MAFSFPPQSYEVKSQRLVIRDPVPEDAEAFVDLMGKVENLPMGETEAMTGLTVDSVVARFGRWKKTSLAGKNAFLSVALRDTNQMVGWMGFNCFRTKEEFDGTVPERDEPTPGLEGRYLTDVGVNIDYRHRRKGYALEAVCSAVEFAFETIGCQVVRLETSLVNERWRGLMVAIGLGDFEEQAPSSYNGEVGCIYKVHKDAWQKVKADLKAKGKWYV